MKQETGHKRRTPRFPFIAIAELNHTNTGTQLGSCLAQLSLNGCYVETLYTLPVGSRVVIKIFALSECFEATAKVIYIRENSGMGLAFEEVSLKSLTHLHRLLREASESKLTLHRR